MVYVVARVTKATRTVPRTTVPALTCGETERVVRQHRSRGVLGTPVRRRAMGCALREPATLMQTRPVRSRYRISPEISSPPTSRPTSALEPPVPLRLRILVDRWSFCSFTARIRRGCRTPERGGFCRAGLGKRPGAGRRHAAEEGRPPGRRAAKAGGVQAEEGSGGSLEIWQIARGERRRGVREGRCDHGDARGSG